MSFEALVEQQAGVVSLTQAVANGISASTVRRWVGQGRWRRIRPAVFLVGGHRYTDEARVRAVALRAGPAGVITGPAAAYWHRMLERAPAVIDLTVPASKPKPQPGARIHRRDLDPEDVRQRLGVRVAAKAFAALETAVALPDGSVFLDRALQKHVPFAEVYRAYCRNMGRPGSAAAGRPAQGQLHHPQRMGSAPLHLARPPHPTGRVTQGDHRNPRPRGVIVRNGTWRPNTGERSRP